MPLSRLPKQHEIGPEALALWSAKVRQEVLKAELLSGISYQAEINAAHLGYRDEGLGVHRIHTLVHMIRPNETDFGGEPGAPPSRISQLDYVYNYAALRSDRRAEILAQLSDMLVFLGAVCGLNPERHRWTFELLHVVHNVTIIVEMRMKHALACRRPVEYSAQIQPMVDTPAHSSYPSGHATEAFALAFVLYRLLRCAQNALPADDDMMKHDPLFVQLMRHAERIAVNRTVAGVHFPVDSVAGMVLAQTLAEFYLRRFAGEMDVWTRTFDGRGFREDFTYKQVLDLRYKRPRDAAAGDDSDDYVVKSDPVPVTCSPLLKYVWTQALPEWRSESLPAGGH
jgi:membrane-associated phospholipid phosphatase